MVQRRKSASICVFTPYIKRYLDGIVINESNCMAVISSKLLASFAATFLNILIMILLLCAFCKPSTHRIFFSAAAIGLIGFPNDPYVEPYSS